MLEAQPDLVRQLDAGVKDDEVLNSLLARAKIIAEKHNISVLVVLRAGLRYGLKFFEDLDADPETGLNALMLQWVDLGGNERADLERAFGKPAKIPTTQAHELATTINQGIAALALNIEKNPRHAANEPAPKSPKKKPRK